MIAWAASKPARTRINPSTTVRNAGRENRIVTFYRACHGRASRPHGFLTRTGPPDDPGPRPERGTDAGSHRPEWRCHSASVSQRFSRSVEPQLNLLGYQLLQHRKYPEAVAIFRLNGEIFPESGNVWNSLGEAYAMEMLGWLRS